MKKAKLILAILKYGKRHVDKESLYHRINYGVYKILNAICVVEVFNTELYASKNI